MRIKKVNGKLFKVESVTNEVSEVLSDKYKTRFFIEFLQEFGLEEKFNRCKTEDERYDIYALYTRVGLSKVHPPEYFNNDTGVYTCKPNNEDSATFVKKPKMKPVQEKPKKEPVQEAPKKEQRNDSYKIKIENEIFLNSFERGQILMGIQKLPKKVIELLNHRGYRIRMVPESELDYGFAGDCNCSAKLIRISLDCNNDKFEVLLHEIGHMIDYEVRKSYMSGSMAFKKIYQHEKMHFVYQSPNMYEYHKKDEREFFAESFREYVLEPWNLKTIAPKTFDFIDKYVKSLRV